MKKAVHFVAVVCLLLVGCASPPLSQQTPGPSPSGDPGGLGGWAGDYQFEEALSAQNSIVYHITITQSGSGYGAEVTVDGFQSMQDLLADVQGDAESVQLVFASYTGDNLWQPYHAGDVLLTLTNQNGSLKTTWGSLTPQLDQNQAPGNYFQGNVG